MCEVPMICKTCLLDGQGSFLGRALTCQSYVEC